VNKEEFMNNWLVFSNISNMLRAGLLALAALGGIMAACAAPAGAQGTVTDNDQYTVFLLQSEAPNGSQVFTDSSAGHTEPHPVTVFGDAHHSTAQARFGSSSMRFDGSGDYLTVPSSVDFEMGTGAFTVDFWYYHVGTGMNGRFFAHTSANRFTGYVLGDCAAFHMGGGGVLSPTGITQPGWHHVAVVRRGDNGLTGVSLDGIFGTWSDQYAGPVPADGLTIASIFNSYFQNGYMEEFRVSKGIARWTENFTPPGAPVGTATPTPQFTATPAPLPATAWPGLMLLVVALTGLLVRWCRK